MLINSFILIFPDQTIMAHSGNGAASEGDVTALGTANELKFDDDTLKGRDSYNCWSCITKRPLTQKFKEKWNKRYRKEKKLSFSNIQHT